MARLERFTRGHGLQRWLLSVYLLHALAADGSGNCELALDRVSRGLEIAAPQDYVRAFLEETPRIVALVSEMHQAAPEFVGRLTGYAGEQGDLEPVRRAVESLIEPLSDRELEVLHLIAAGLSNREIAEELVIAVGTVKRHINHIYGKLRVHSRTQALVRARELDLV